MKLTCGDCGLVVETAERDTAEKLLQDHKAREHDNKQEQIRELASKAKSMAFAIVNGSAPKRRDARSLVSLASQVLNEPIPDMDEQEKAPATEPAKADPGGKAQPAKEAGDSSKAK